MYVSIKNNRPWASISVLVLMLACCSPIVIAQADSATADLARGRNGMVATAHPLASQAALDILKAGGNAVDAAVAAAFAIGVVEPDGSGLGGGGGMVVYLRAQDRAVYIDYYQQASSEVDKISYDVVDDRYTAKAVLIPGTVAGLTLALETFGTLPLETVMAPAIGYAENGFAIDATLAQLVLDNNVMLQTDSATAAVFLDSGFPRMEGDMLVQADLARTLRTIAAQGRDGFYRGPVAEALSRRVTELGGAMTIADLESYKAIVSAPLESTYRGYRVLAANVPQSGIAVLEALNMFEQEDLAALGHYGTSSETLHLMAETFRRVYADRWQYMGDPAFSHVPINGLISKAYARERFNDINRFKADPADYRKTTVGNPDRYDQAGESDIDEPQVKRAKRTSQWGDGEDENATSYDEWSEDLFDSWGGAKKDKDTAGSSRERAKNSPADTTREPEDTDADEHQEFDGHTTHLSVIDKDGNMVSLSQTLGTFFGAGLTVDGVLLNCGMSNFSASSNANMVAPRKRPRSSISPMVLLKDNKPYMVIGSPGAGRITCAVAEMIVNIIDFKMNPAQANAAPRFYCQKYDDYLYLEGGIAEEVGARLERMGHTLRWYNGRDLFFGGVQVITVDPVTGEYLGSADPRRGGVALGF